MFYCLGGTVVSEKVEERIKELEERLSKTIPNKHTQKSINFIRAQLAKLRNELVKIATSKKGGGGGYSVKKSGDAQVAFIGYPSVGKSSLLNLLTGGNTNSKVASYDFTTLQAIPGMMDIEQAKIQLIDLPGIILGAATGKGRGREIIGTARSAELILIIICYKPDGNIKYSDLEVIRKELYDAGIRLNQAPANIQVTPRGRGGIGFAYSGHQEMDLDEVKALMNELGISNAGVYFYDPDITPEQLIDHVMANRVYSKEFVVINKSDLAQGEVFPEEITKAIGHDKWIRISALNQQNIDELRHRVFQELDLIRVYLRPPGKEADMEHPMILHKGDTIERLCAKIHRNFIDNYRYALVWGTSVKHPGQKFNAPDHVLEDSDIVMIYLKR